MIYVIAAAHIINGVTKEQIIASKGILPPEAFSISITIGYTTDFTKRRSQYSSSLPRFNVLFTYEDGTEEDKEMLHQYFSKFSDDNLNGREWFRWDGDIIRFFKSHPTIESIREAIIPVLKKNRVVDDDFETLVNPILYKLIKNEGRENDYERLSELHNEMLNTWKKVNTVSELFPILKTFYDPAKIDEVDSWYSTQLSLVVDIETNVYSLSTITCFNDKMKYVCELVPTLDQDHRELFLDSIPMVFKKYYIALGPGGCELCKYQQVDLERENIRER